MTQIIKGYKVTNKHLQCQNYQFEIGKVHTQAGALIICRNGFHFCEKLSACFSYYSFNRENRVFEIEAQGEIVTEGNKSVCKVITLVRELTWEEVLKLANEGLDNTGHSNTGDSNTGDSNTGDSNTGYSNTGDSNTGDSNTGDWNTGDWNTGYRNTGDSNTGDSNTGDRNTGYSNTGYWNTGDRNTGDSNTGDWNTGYRNTGDRNTGYSNTGDSNTGDSNTGDWNTGYRNTGDWNTGDRNTGYSNTGDRNTGDSNTGDRNTGDWNTGDRNTGYSNTGDRNTGLFCTENAPFPIFDQPSEWTEKDFLNSKVYSLMRNCVDTKMWIPMSMMTDDEKANNHGWKTAEGYVKDIPFKEAFLNAWHNFSDANKQEFLDLPNFNAAKFEHITGVKINSKG